MKYQIGLYQTIVLDRKAMMLQKKWLMLQNKPLMDRITEIESKATTHGT